MPSRCQSACLHPGCRTLCSTKLCDLHHAEAEARKKEWERLNPWKSTTLSPKERGYDYEWQKLSRKFKRNNPICNICKVRASEETDHIIEKADGGTNELSNLQALCAECHAKKTIAERNRRIKERQAAKIN
jgi:5-methylcytosine-specific restriction protein A